MIEIFPKIGHSLQKKKKKKKKKLEKKKRQQKTPKTIE